jgi:hypothetical protein
MFKIMHEDPDPAGLPATDYTPGLEAIILRALARDPDRRYGSLDDMRTELERLVRETAPRLLQRAAPREPAPEPAAGAAEAAARRQKVEKEKAEIHGELERARGEGQLQKALVLARRLLELDPDDPAVATVAREVEATIRDKELEQLCEMALSYAADGDVELSLKIAARIERMAPDSPRYGQLRAYLDEETSRRRAKALTAQACDQLADGKLAEALASAQEALAAYPSHQAAEEIRDRVEGILAVQARQAPAAGAPGPPAESPAGAATEPERPAAGPPASPAEEPAAATAPPPDALTPLPEGPPESAEAAALLESARRLLRGRDPRGALPLLEQASALEPGHAGLHRLLALTRVDARKADVESLTTAALDHFVRNDYGKARKAVEQVLALDPRNKKARELQTILGALG